MGDMDLQIFSDRLRELRTSHNLTQAQFVDGLGITASALSAYEKNLKNPSISVAKKIAEKYHVSIDWLCGLSNRKSQSEKPQTYADVIDLFVNAESAIFFNVKDGCKLFISEPIMNSFLQDWGKILDLYHDGIIDKKLYELWVNDKKREYNVQLGNAKEISDFQTYLNSLDDENEDKWAKLRGIED